MEQIRNKRVVYTCITGKYDKLRKIEGDNPFIDFVCITDNVKRCKAIKDSGWQVVDIGDFMKHHFTTRCIPVDEIRKARMVKIIGFQPFIEQGYEETMWIDANFGVKENLNQFFDEHKKAEADITTFRHPLRKCTYTEGFTCIEFDKGDPNEILNQLKKYLAEGYPVNNGMISSGLLIRNSISDDMIKFNSEWWSQVMNESSRDQLSFNYCFENYKDKLKLGLIPYDVLGKMFHYDTKHG